MSNIKTIFGRRAYDFVYCVLRGNELGWYSKDGVIFPTEGAFEVLSAPLGVIEVLQYRVAEDNSNGKSKSWKFVMTPLRADMSVHVFKCRSSWERRFWIQVSEE